MCDWDVYLYARSGPLVICDRAGGPSRQCSSEGDVGRGSTRHAGGCSVQMLHGTAQCALRPCSQSHVPATPFPEVDPRTAWAFLRSGACLMRATSLLGLASGLEGKTHNVGEFLRNKKEMPQGCGKFFQKKKALIGAPWPQRGNHTPFPLHRGPGPWALWKPLGFW